MSSMQGDAPRKSSREATADLEGLAGALHARVRGEVRFDAGSRALYATDASNYRQVPIGVVLPRDAEDVVETVAVCKAFGVPVLPRGAGTSLAGQCCNAAVVLDMTRHMRHIVRLDPQAKSAIVQPGLVLDELRDAGQSYGLTFGPDPATHDRCTLGGMIGNNSCGVHSVMAGKTDDNVDELEVLTYDGARIRVGRTSDADLQRIVREGGRRGEIYARLAGLRDRYAGLIRERYPRLPRRVSGYNFPQLLPENGFHVARALVGSEGTCVTVLEATVRLVHSPLARTLLVLGYPDVYAAADHVVEILRAGPIGLEGMDDHLRDDIVKKSMHPERLALLPEGNGWLLVEFGGDTKHDSDLQARALMSALGKKRCPPSMKLYDDPREEQRVWAVRESGLGATARVPGARDTWEGWEDSAVPPEKLGDYLRALRALFDRYGYACALYGHFGQGCVHTRIDFDLVTREGIAKYRSFVYDAADLVLRFGGSFSGEHGDGQSRAELLPKMFGDELVQAFREFKSIWDPDWKMNPGKIVDPQRLDQNLRLGSAYRPAMPETYFRFQDDAGSLARATERCVGVGECRRLHHGTMCPSYMVTLEEKHSTRGRAHLLFEMLRGDGLHGGWRDEHVKEALDLCLACKGCKSECPVNVDVATYKAEFMAHYYQGRLRPCSAYAMGLVYRWARLASRMPRLVNAMTQTRGSSALVKALGGFAPQRRIPRFAPHTFRSWFERREGGARDGLPQVVLWPDTFTNYFHPEVGQAAVAVLEAAGYRVQLPRRTLCCGRPLYDFGMLARARQLLRGILEELDAHLVAGTPIVVLEPSCFAVFHDELVNLLPHDEHAARLTNRTFLLGEFLRRHAPSFRPPRLERRALVHGHCHQKALFGLDVDEKLLRDVGLDLQVLDSGCCGMAGSFGFERGERYEVSVRAGERVLLPAVRAATPDTLVVADGFSCREQIGQCTARRALHLAEVLELALREGQEGSASSMRLRNTTMPSPSA